MSGSRPAEPDVHHGAEAALSRSVPPTLVRRCCPEGLALFLNKQEKNNEAYRRPTCNAPDIVPDQAVFRGCKSLENVKIPVFASQQDGRGLLTLPAAL